MLDQGPQLFEESAQILRLLLGLLEFLVEKFFTITQQANQLLVFCLQYLYFLNVGSFFGVTALPGPT